MTRLKPQIDLEKRLAVMFVLIASDVEKKFRKLLDSALMNLKYGLDQLMLLIAI